MEINELIKNNEKTYNGKKEIRYVFCEGNNPNKLIVTFPGFASPGMPPQYNYINTLMDCDCHRLFILDDYGPRGSYLIGENRDHSIEDSVVSLILNTCENYGIESKNVILQGSAKGGYCALYFGIKYNFGYVIAGAPEIKMGDYLLNVVPEVAEYIAGGKHEDDRVYLNDLLFDLVDLSSGSFPEIFIHVGKGDHHYPDHILPFLEKLDGKRIDYNINLANYSSHGWVGSYYQEYLLKTLNYIDKTMINPKPAILKSDIKIKNGFLEVRCTAQGENLQYACYIFKENNVIQKIFYQKEPFFQYPINSKGTYRARIYVKENEEINSTLTDEIIIDYDAFFTYINYRNGFLKVRCATQGENLQYACYIFKENNVIQKIFYQKEPFFQYPINSKGTYRARIYVKENEEINSKFTDEIVVDYNNTEKFESNTHSGGEFDIDIYGSCVSRDIFNFDTDNEVLLGKYFARNSFISAVSEPFPQEIDLNISSPWQKRMVETDLRKDMFEQLSINNAKYLLIDFIDERAALMRYKNSIFTLSMELQNSNFSELFNGEIINKFGLDKSFWQKTMDECIENLLEIYDEERIIIHETYFVYSFITKSGETKSFPENRINYYTNLNKILKEYYDYLKTKLPNAIVLNIIGKYDTASENHRWGISPVHYEDAYYKDALNIIKSIINK